jgi:UDP-glucose 4-epimerase
MGFVLAIENIDRARNNIFNIAGYAPFSYRDVIEKVADDLSVPWMSVKLNGPEKYEISNEKATKLLGYKPQYNIDRMIEKALKKKKSSP